MTGRRATAGERVTAYDVLSFLIPLLIAFEVKIIGRLFVPEVLLLVALPLLLAARERRRFHRAACAIIVLGLVWFWSQVITDIVRLSAFGDYTRGWTRIGFTLINFAALYLLIGESRRRLVIFVMGLSLGLLLQYWINPNQFAPSEP